MSKIVRIGAATAFFNDSRMGIAQLLEKAEGLDYIIFDFLAESVMGGMGRGMATGSGQGYAADFVGGYILPHLQTLLDRRIRIVANAGGLNPGRYWHDIGECRSGWRAAALIPIIGLDAAAKARRVGEELFARANSMLRHSQLPPLERTRCDVIGGEGSGPTTALCRIVADHPDKDGADLLLREQASAISHMSVGISLGLGDRCARSSGSPAS